MEIKVPDAWDWLAHDIQKFTRAQILYLAIVDGTLDGVVTTNSRIFSYPQRRFEAINIMRAVSRDLMLDPTLYKDGLYRSFAEQVQKRTSAKSVFLMIMDGELGSGITLVGSPEGVPWIIQNFRTIIADYQRMVSSDPHH